MSRINTNINSLIAQRTLSANNQALTKSLERLSTGYRVNRGGDDPAGLIASETLRSEKTKIAAAIKNAERADQLVNVAEGGLQEISGLLVELQSLVSEAGSDAGLSDGEKEANQLQIDNILASIDRIASTTTFAGSRLLNGNLDFTVEGVDGNVVDFQVNGAKMAEGTSTVVQTIVTASAHHGAVFLSAGGTSLDFGGNAEERFVFELAGANGAREFSFASGTTLAAMATAVNGFTAVTGVSAVASGNFLSLKSTTTGADQFVSMRLIDDGGGNQDGSLLLASGSNQATYTTTGAVAFSALNSSTPFRGEGQDVQGTINGVAARGRGNTLSVKTDALDLSVTLDLEAGGAQTLGATNVLTITGGGANFNLGPDVNIGNQVRLGIKNIASRNIGKTMVDGTQHSLQDLGSGRFANVVTGNVTEAQGIVNNAITEVSNLRGRLGAFQNLTVQSTIRSLGISLENVSAAESVIRDTDFAAETADLTRNQILVQAASSALQISNNQPSAVLALLG